MSKISSIKKYNTNNKGFTLVELLATVSVLSLVMVIGIYIAINVIDNSKEKSYQVTIKNIEDMASGYVLEKSDSVSWVPIDISDYEYQCLTVQNLMDVGYFKGDVLESYVAEGIKVEASNYLYIERKKGDKAVTKSVLLVGDRLINYNSLCDDIDTEGNISFEISPSGWSKQKEITINYNLYNNLDKFSNYKYEYNYVVNDAIVKDLNSNFDKLSAVEKLNVFENGILYAKIVDKDDNLVISNSLVVGKIDNIDPFGEITSTNDVASLQTVTLEMSDNALLTSYYFGKNDPLSEGVIWRDISGDLTNYELDVNVLDGGTYYLGVKDGAGNISIVSKTFYKTLLSVNNATVAPTAVITMSGNSFTIPEVFADPYYTFLGWYMDSDYNGSSITTYTPNSNKTLYGKVIENRLVGGSVLINGTAIYGNTLSADIVEHTTPKADKYTYQWYSSSTNSMSGGVPISGATSDKLTLSDSQYDKYIYVVVTAVKDNYRTTTFSDIIDVTNNGGSKVLKRPIKVTAGSSSKVYDGSPLTNSACTSADLMFGHSVSCVMTANSTITNVGSVDNVIDTVAIYNDLKNATVNQYYDITYVDGMLTITKANATIPTTSAYCKTGLVYNGTEQKLTNDEGVGYTFSNNVKTDAGSYSVLATLDGNYKWNDGSTSSKTLNCSIDKAEPTLAVTPSSMSIVKLGSKDGRYIYKGDGAISCDSSDLSIATCSIDASTKRLLVTAGNTVGNVTITVNAAASNNYNAISKNVSVDVVPTYNINYNSNGGSGTMTSTTCTYGLDCSLLKNTYTLTGYGFKGWNTKADGSGTTYTDEYVFTPYNISNDLTLYAMWGQNDIRIYYNTNGGTIQTNSTYNFSKDANGFVLKDGSLLSHTVTNGGNIGTDGLVNYNNSSYLKVNKTGYSVLSSSEWNTKADGSGKSFNQATNYAYSDFSGYAVDKGDYYRLDLYVNWKPITYTVKYDANGGEGAPAGQMKTYGQTLTLSSTEPTRLGYIFLGWSVDADATSATYAPEDSYTENKSITLYAIWSPRKLQVNFYRNYTTNDTNMVSQTFSYGVSNNKFGYDIDGTNNGLFDSFDRIGYTLLGWADSSGATSAMFNTYYDITDQFILEQSDNVLVTTINLYAVWKANTYKINYNSNGGSGTMAFNTCSYGLDCSLRQNTYTLAGYKFSGWNTKADGSGTSYDDKGNFKYLLNTDMTLYAQWKRNDIKIYYNTNGGTIQTNSTYNFSKDANGFVLKDGSLLFHTITSGSNIGTDGLLNYNNSSYLNVNKAGYLAVVSSEWNTKADGSGKSFNQTINYNYSDFSGYAVDKGDYYRLDLYVNWESVDYTVKYDANGGSGAPSSQTKKHGKNLTLSSSSPTWENGYYKFKGWNTKADGSGTSYAVGGTYTNDASVTLYAQWQIHEHEWVAIGNRIFDLVDKYKFTCGHYHRYGYALYCKICHMSVRYYEKANDIDLAAFGCPCEWGLDTFYDDSSLGGNLNKLKEFDGPLFNGTLLPILATKPDNWVDCSEHKYTISFGSNGGSGTTDSKVCQTNRNCKLPANGFTKTGYTFNGWNTKADGSGTSYVNNANFEYSLYTGMTLYAQWKANEFTITISKNGNHYTSDYHIYGRYNDGLYIDSARTKKMTSIYNCLSISYGGFDTFKGAYADKSGTGSMLINASGCITTALTPTTYTSDTTIYMKW